MTAGARWKKVAGEVRSLCEPGRHLGVSPCYLLGLLLLLLSLDVGGETL